MYATVADLVGEYGEDEIRQLSDRDHNNAIDESLVNTKIEAASAEVDDYLRGRIDVPFAADAVPPTIKRATLKIARYNLYIDPTDAVRADYRDTLNMLKDIQSGKMVLGGGTQEQTQSSSLPRIKSAAPIIGDHDLNLYREPRLTY